MAAGWQGQEALEQRRPEEDAHLSLTATSVDTNKSAQCNSNTPGIRAAPTVASGPELEFFNPPYRSHMAYHR